MIDVMRFELMIQEEQKRGATARVVACVLFISMFVSLDAGLADEAAQVPETSLHFPGETLFNSSPPFLAGVSVNHSDATYREGDTLEISFMAEEDAFLHLLYHQADGSSLLLFPNVAAADNFVPARTKTLVPPPGLPPTQQYRFRVQPPLGHEVLQVLASRRRIPELDTLANGSHPAAPVPPQLISSLATRLSSEPANWTEHRVRIQTVSPDGSTIISNETPRPQPNTLDPNPPNEPTNDPPSRVGLFIGIGKYANPDLASTHTELAESARVMHRLMLDHGKLDPNRTKLLTNEQATRHAIETSIVDWLPSVTRPGDVVFIYFSGHSGQFETRDPKEPDGFDEAIAPYDLTAGQADAPREQRLKLLRESNIVDDTLARWIQELQGRQVVLMFDTCHSGGIIANKQLLEDELFADEAARIKDIVQLNTLILTSCAADEQSLFEGTPNGTMWFTYCLTEAINRRDPEIMLSVQDAFSFARERVKQLLVEGNAGRQQSPAISDNIFLPVPLVPASTP